MSAAGAEQAASFELALASLGIACTIDARERLALLVPHDDSAVSRLRDVGTRSEVLALAMAHGFTHAAVELRITPVLAHGAGAPLPRD